MKKQKQIKKEEKIKKEELINSLETNESLKSIVLNLLGVLIVFLLFYFVTNMLVDTSPKFNVKEEENISNIQYDEIIAGEIYNKPGEFYVLFYDFSSYNKEYYDSLIEKSEKKVYKVDISKKFNKDFVSEKSNLNVESLNELKVSTTTLIKIENQKIILSVESEIELIKTHL